MCGGPVLGCEVALSYWEKAEAMKSGWRYVHIKCVLKMSQNKEECNKTQKPVKVKEALVSIRAAMTQIAIEKMRGKEDAEDF
jgi:hypothetical protein